MDNTNINDIADQPIFDTELGINDNSLAGTKLNDIIIVSKPETITQIIEKTVIISSGLAVGSNTESSEKTSLAVGTAVSALAENTFALGVSAIASEPNTFVWNGVSSEMYAPTNGQGTFNINTENGVRNIYIGDKSLYDIIQDQALKIKYGQN